MKLEIKVKNTGQKNVAAAEWQITIYDTIRDRVMDQFKFRTDDKTLKPGESKKFRKYIDHSSTPNYARAAAKVLRVEFSDGSVWVCR